ncbi:Polyribonucleotide nucleotidyltransferase, partial [Dissostichus eleginoides]
DDHHHYSNKADTSIHGDGQHYRKGSDSRRAFLTRPPGGNIGIHGGMAAALMLGPPPGTCGPALMGPAGLPPSLTYGPQPRLSSSLYSSLPFNVQPQMALLQAGYSLLGDVF